MLSQSAVHKTCKNLDESSTFFGLWAALGGVGIGGLVPHGLDVIKSA